MSVAYQFPSTPEAIHRAVRRKGALGVRPGRVTRAERLKVVTEEVEALRWRVEDAKNTLRVLERMLELSELRLARLT